jgi:hypothetical protein
VRNKIGATPDNAQGAQATGLLFLPPRVGASEPRTSTITLKTPLRRLLRQPYLFYPPPPPTSFRAGREVSQPWFI